MIYINRKLLLIILLPIIILGQNEVCFDIKPNPDPFDPALNSFTKYINVLDCIKISNSFYRILLHFLSSKI